MNMNLEQYLQIRDHWCLFLVKTEGSEITLIRSVELCWNPRE
jgi:hypothetical protein